MPDGRSAAIAAANEPIQMPIPPPGDRERLREFRERHGREAYTLFPADAAGRHQPMHLMHKYWARKDWYVVRGCIEHYTRPGHLVLDPFCGSGVTVSEALATRRRAVGIDLNPMATFITEMVTTPVPEKELERAFGEVEMAVKDAIIGTYRLDGGCPACRAQEGLIAWHTTRGSRTPSDYIVEPLCLTCHATGEERRISSREVQRLADLENRCRQAAVEEDLWWPAEAQLRYPDATPYRQKRRIERFEQHFTRRNLLNCARLFKAIRAVSHRPSRRALLYCFTSHLACVSAMNGKRVSGSGWMMNRFYVPPDFYDESVWERFRRTYQKLRRANAQTAALIGERKATVECGSAADLHTIQDQSVDYVFTDPPYGDSIDYYELTDFWRAWLGLEMDHAEEIVINERQGKDARAFGDMLARAASEMYRVLKPGAWCSVAFQNKDAAVWSAFSGAFARPGFELTRVVPQQPSAKSFTMTWSDGSPKTHVIVHLRKPREPARRRRRYALPATLRGLVTESVGSLRDNGIERP
ncbi:MAG: DNA methyltransferase, partial [Armatimonadota bacterium]